MALDRFLTVFGDFSGDVVGVVVWRQLDELRPKSIKAKKYNI